MYIVEDQQAGHSPRWAILALDELSPKIKGLFGRLGQVTRQAEMPVDPSYCLIYLTLHSAPRDRSAQNGVVRISESGDFKIPAAETCGIQLEFTISRIPNPHETRVVLTTLLGGWVTTHPKQSPIHLGDLEQAILEGVRILGTYRWEPA